MSNFFKKSVGRIFRNKRSKKVRREDAIFVTEGISSINDCFNSLKDNLLYMYDQKRYQIIQIESTVSGEGKTTMTCNLAVSLSFNNKKVLIIDLDFRRPRVNRVFGLSNETGVVDFLSEKISFNELIMKTSYNNVDVITRGSPIYTPSVLFTSERFRELMEKLRGLYDYILLDSPPIIQVSDFMHICKVSDGMLFAVAYGRTKRSQVKEATELIKNAEVNVIGTVLTFVDKKDPYASFYGSYRQSYGFDEPQ